MKVWIRRSRGFLCWAALALPLAARQAPSPVPPKAPAPRLLPGEGLALGVSGTPPERFGTAGQEAPLGDLAQLAWLRLEGGEWGARRVAHKCTGGAEGARCGGPKGHGRVDLSKALQENCRSAFLAWIQSSVEGWKELYGEGAARARLEEAFAPFLAKRMPKGEGVPALDSAWVGGGELLRASPEAILGWLFDPAQEGLSDQARRHLTSFFSESPWWFMAAPAEQGGWVLASDGAHAAVLRLPAWKGRPEALARMKALLGAPAK